MEIKEEPQGVLHIILRVNKESVNRRQPQRTLSSQRSSLIVFFPDDETKHRLLETVFCSGNGVTEVQEKFSFYPLVYVRTILLPVYVRVIFSCVQVILTGVCAGVLFLSIHKPLLPPLPSPPPPPAFLHPPRYAVTVTSSRRPQNSPYTTLH